MTDMARRKVNLALAWAAAAFACNYTKDMLKHAGEPESSDTLAPQLELQTLAAETGAVVKSFDNASTGLLMAAYGNFYPLFMGSRQYFGAPRELAKAVKAIELPRNPHRLEALPAAAAAHAISLSTAKHLEELSAHMALGLSSASREAREITLQNMISASAPSTDSAKRWTLHSTVLEKLFAILRDAEASPQLLSPASFVVTLLLNTKAILVHRGTTADYRKAEDIDRRLGRALASKASHFVYLKRLRDAHTGTFKKYDPTNEVSLPGHGSEMIIQADGVRKAARTYTQEASLIHARLIFDVWRIANSVPIERTPFTISEEQASRALPKLVEFEATVGMHKHLAKFKSIELPASEHSFKAFLTEGLLPELRKFDPKANPQCSHIEALGKLPRPLAGYSTQGKADHAGSKGINSLYETGLETLAELSVVKAIHSYVAEDDKLEKVAKKSAKAAFGQRVEPHFGPIERQEIAAYLSKEVEKIGDQLDEVDSQIGSIKVRDADENDRKV
jgi:hypothetical protein